MVRHHNLMATFPMMRPKLRMPRQAGRCERGLRSGEPLPREHPTSCAAIELSSNTWSLPQFDPRTSIIIDPKTTASDARAEFATERLVFSSSIAYRIIRERHHHEDLGSNYFDERNRRATTPPVSQLERLGYKVTVEDA